MGIMFDALPDKDKIEFYLNAFSGRDNATCANADLSYILRFWERNKKHIFDAFGGNFILKKKITYQQDDDETEKAIREINRNHVFIRNYKNFILDYFEKYEENHPNDINADRYTIAEKRNCALDLTEPGGLVLSCYQFIPFSLKTPEGNTIKVQVGAKPIRMLGKIAQAFGLEGFEDYRIKISQVLNQRKISGTFCLSIHPLDFMTMSDNECDWYSCMNWMNGGEYRMGTVEMMNSPMVIVGYLESKSPMAFGPYEWNNKKWRNLFIVTEDLITSIKDYPYHNDYFCEQMVDWLLEIFGRENYLEPHNLANDSGEIYLRQDHEDEDYCYTMISNAMYNDFANNAHFTCAFGKNASHYGEVYFSGEAECMNCGEALEASPGECEGIDEMSDLVCDGCIQVEHCDYCEHRIYGHNTYEVDGYTLCEDCYCDNTSCDYFTDEVHLNDNLERVYLVKHKIDESTALDEDTFYSLEDIRYYGINWTDYFHEIRTAFRQGGWNNAYRYEFNYVTPEDIKECYRDNIPERYWYDNNPIIPEQESYTVRPWTNI